MNLSEALYIAQKIARREHNAAEAKSLMSFLQTASAEDAQKTLESYYVYLEDRTYEPAQERLVSRLRDLQLEEIFNPALRVPQPGTRSLRAGHTQLFKTSWLKYAAAILVFFSAATYFYFLKQRQVPAIANSKNIHHNDIAPGQEGAILTLADGSILVLDSLGNQSIAHQNGVSVTLRNQQLIYEEDADEKKSVVYNTMTTPRGRQFCVVLADGSKAWLNASSAIRFPTSFKEGQRQVELQGEAYFEVVKDTKRPFKVKVNDQATVEVLGTHFNIKAYGDEETMSTTLLEGVVRVINKNERIVLKPGEQAKVNNSQKIKIAKNVNIAEVMAWKNGLFNFNNAHLEEVMRQLSRWYDIEVVYPNGIPNIYFVGDISRDLTFEDLLETLTKTGVHFKIENGRKLLVQP